jgi:hypothetical protein
MAKPVISCGSCVDFDGVSVDVVRCLSRLSESQHRKVSILYICVDCDPCHQHKCLMSMLLPKIDHILSTSTYMPKNAQRASCNHL